MAVYGVPPDSQVFHPRVNAGRSLLPGEGRAIMLCNRIAEQEGIGVGDEVTLTIAGRDSTWTVVGLLSLDISAGSVTNFVPFDTLVKEAGHAGRGNTVVVISDVHDAASQERLVDALSDVYAARRIEWTTLSSAEELCQDLYAAFDMISYLLLTMVFLAAIVGSLGLTGTLSINVAERRREIGVVRAVGAVSRDVFALFVAEGVFLGVLSWLLAAPLSYPGARLLSDAVGMAYFHSPLEFSYSFPSAILWLLIVTLISALASAWPAWRATRVSVREALTYE